MKLFKSISLAVMMIFLFSLPQYSMASKYLQDRSRKKTENTLSREKLDNIIISQRGRRSRILSQPGMSGPRGGMSGQRGRMSGPRGGMSGQRGRMSGPRGGMSGQQRGQQMGQDEEALTNDSGEGSSEIQSDQSMIQTKRRRGRKMRNRMQQRGTQGRGDQQMGQDEEALTNDSGEVSSEIQSDESMRQTQRRRGRRMRNRMRNRMQQRGMQGRGNQQMGQDGGGNGPDKRGSPP